ncbi:MAG TPA: ATP-binding protein [Acidimicrobiales bacterium]|nr:ATP-binding protein [Acidimicrobiales bacterium]
MSGGGPGGRWVNLRKPLDRVGSIKLKLGVAIVTGVAAGSFVTYLGVGEHWSPTARPVLRITVALIVVLVLTRGMTSPLREMAAAARTMAAGGWGQRVTDTSADEVGELARAFNAMAAELAAVDRMRKDLIANVSHELRTPISALQARLENMVDGVEPPDPALLGSMLDQVERLGRLVAQLLDLSRLESGAVPLRREDVEVAPLLDAVAAEARLHAPGRRIDIAVEPGDLRLHADPDRVHQVLANLTANALRHGPDARPVTLSAARHDGHVVLTVADEGPGIPAAEAERVFERFYRADAARPGSGADGTGAGAGAESGAGLGLAIARWIVDLHGGDIRALANEPVGCAVVCRLPAPHPPSEDPAP